MVNKADLIKLIILSITKLSSENYMKHNFLSNIKHIFLTIYLLFKLFKLFDSYINFFYDL